MNPVTVAFILAVLELVMKYGIPAAMKIIETWQQADTNILHAITLEDIERLKALVPPPATYFEEEKKDA